MALQRSLVETDPARMWTTHQDMKTSREYLFLFRAQRLTTFELFQPARFVRSIIYEIVANALAIIDPRPVDRLARRSGRSIIHGI